MWTGCSSHPFTHTHYFWLDLQLNLVLITPLRSSLSLSFPSLFIPFLSTFFYPFHSFLLTSFLSFHYSEASSWGVVKGIITTRPPMSVLSLIFNIWIGSARLISF